MFLFIHINWCGRKCSFYIDGQLRKLITLCVRGGGGMEADFFSFFFTILSKYKKENDVWEYEGGLRKCLLQDLCRHYQK